jgi:hypothetical protein
MRIQAQPCLILLLLSLAPGSRALATTWIVECDAGQPTDQIGAVVAGAASGDTILIGPGRYFEHIPLPDDVVLTFIGRDGATATILDGSTEIAGREGSILYASLHRHPGDLALQGLSLVNGTGNSLPGPFGGGGGALYWNSGTASLTIRSCQFENNRAVLPGGYWNGGAIKVGNCYTSLIEGCSFRGNMCSTEVSTGDGQDLYLAGGIGPGGPGGMSHTIRGCRFDMVGPPISYGPAVWAHGESLLIEDCWFESDASAADQLWALHSEVTDAQIRNNTLVARGGSSGTGMHVLQPYSEWTYCTMTGNRFWAEMAPPGSGVILQAKTVLEDNCFVRTGVKVSDTEYCRQVDLARNVFYQSPVEINARGLSTISCCVTWPDSLVVNHRCPAPVFDRVLRADPLFCEDASGSFEVATTSPCFGDPSLPGCGVIGGVTAGCVVTAVEKLSWGRIKSRYR